MNSQREEQPKQGSQFRLEIRTNIRRKKTPVDQEEKNQNNIERRHCARTEFGTRLPKRRQNKFRGERLRVREFSLAQGYVKETNLLLSGIFAALTDWGCCEEKRLTSVEMSRVHSPLVAESTPALGGKFFPVLTTLSRRILLTPSAGKTRTIAGEKILSAQKFSHRNIPIFIIHHPISHPESSWNLPLLSQFHSLSSSASLAEAWSGAWLRTTWRAHYQDTSTVVLLQIKTKVAISYLLFWKSPVRISKQRTQQAPTSAKNTAIPGYSA